MPFRRMKLKS